MDEKEKILVINDDEAIRRTIALFLQDSEYEVVEANSGCKGIEQALQKEPDLILLDIIMPEMNGYETCIKLKSDPKTKDIPIIFLSSLSSPKDKIKGLEIGAVDFINNIADPGEMLARVRTHLKIQSLNTSLMHSNQLLCDKQRALDENLRAAAMIQRSFLPSNLLKYPNLEISWAWIPSNPLGGDIFNAIPFKDKVILYMVDVSGHDVPSALVTISVSQFLHQQILSSSSVLPPKQLLSALDKEYPIERFDRYFTIFYSILDLTNGNFLYSCAGHPPAMLLKPNKKCALLDIGGTIIGFNRGFAFEESMHKLEPGDKIILYTDGITDMRNPQGEIYGTDRFTALLESIKMQPIQSIVDKVQQETAVFRNDRPAIDDMSLLGIEYRRA